MNSQVQNMSNTTTISFKIDDIKLNKKDHVFEGKEVNLSKVKKVISKLAFIPMSQLKIQKIIKPGQSESDEGFQEKQQYKDSDKIENKSTLIFGIDSLQKQQIYFQFTNFYYFINCSFNVYEDDTLFNLRTKIYIEMKTQKEEHSSFQRFENPDEIQMTIKYEKNDYQIQPQHLEMTVRQFLEENIKSYQKNELFLYFQKLNTKFLEFLVQDQIYQTGTIKKQYPIEQDKEILLKVIINQFQQDIQNNHPQKFEDLYAKYSDSIQDRNEFFYRLYQDGILLVTMGTDSDDIKKQLADKKEVLKDGSMLNFVLASCNQ